MKLNVPPTKSNLLSLKKQLSFALEGSDLLEQKRQILIAELMSRLDRARAAEQRVADAFKEAFAALHEATLSVGSQALDRASVAVLMQHQVSLFSQHLIGVKIPHTTTQVQPLTAQFGFTGTSVQVDVAMQRFIEILPLLAELAELENAVQRLARELRKTQRRCNALSKIVIPNLNETIGYIDSLLEERERESFILFRMIRDRLAASREKL